MKHPVHRAIIIAIPYQIKLNYLYKSEQSSLNFSMDFFLAFEIQAFENFALFLPCEALHCIGSIAYYCLALHSIA